VRNVASEKTNTVSKVAGGPGTPELTRDPSVLTLDGSPVPEALDVSIVIPTFNERVNVALVICRLGSALSGLNWEVIFVDDDSHDGTASHVKTIAQSHPRIRCIRRVGRRGLAGACIEGMLSSHAQYVAVMDCDLQHDETVLPEMLASLRRGGHDIVIASRYLSQGAVGGLSKKRLKASRFATAVARAFIKSELSDPLSGFFMLRREIIEDIAPKLSTQGFKILLDILISTHGVTRIQELPAAFRKRQAGTSKLDARTFVDFVSLLVTKATMGLIPVRFVSFLMVGVTGIFIHMAALRAVLILFELNFPGAQAIATILSMSNNFICNNLLTYRDQRLSGIYAVKGLFSYYLIGAMGALSSVGVASWFYANRPVWWLAGFLGSIVGAVWNYSMSRKLVWGQRGH
jgi:dolichol-phosphate mannosyltransferase